MIAHPEEADLALLAGGDCHWVARFFLRRHVAACPRCAAQVERFRSLRVTLQVMGEPPQVNWTSLAAEMKANIRLGLEAGECVRTVERSRGWNPRLTVAFASLSFLVCAGLLMQSPTNIPRAAARSAASPVPESPVLESNGNGLELRDGASSITLINRRGGMADQSVSAQGEISGRHVEGGAVTFNNVSLD